eukprot:67771_1
MFAMSWISCFVSFIVALKSYQLPPISPITSDVDTEYYFTNTTSEFESGYIQCSAENPNCQIQCHAASACKYLYINASLTQNLLLECDGTYACQYIMVYGPNVSANVQCMTGNACTHGVFELDDTKNVNVKCDGWSSNRNTQSYACGYAEINAANAEDLDIQCLGHASCKDASVNGTFVSNSINILCNDYLACEATIYGLYSNQVNVLCNSTQANDLYSCKTLAVYCPSKRANQCNFDCGSGDQKTCIWIDIYNADKYTPGFLNVSMNAGTCSQSPPFAQGEACSDFTSNCLSSGLSTVYYHTPTIDHCTDYECCPITDYKVTTECVDGSDCVLNCTAVNDPFDIQCLKATIDARNANSLTVFCGSSEACMGASITCPLGDCTIICSARDACTNLYLNASLSTNTNVECSYSCEAMTVYATDNVNVDILCDEFAYCRGSEFYVSNTETVNVICNGEFSCGSTQASSATTIYAEDTGNTNILCDGIRSCTHMIIRAKGSDNINVDCEATSGLGSCQYLTLYCPQTEHSCALNCADTTGISTYGSCQSAEVHFLSKALTNINQYSPILNLSCPTNGKDCNSMRFDCRNYDLQRYSNSDNTYLWDATAQQSYCEYNSNYFCCAHYNEIYCEPDQDCNVMCNDTQRCSTAVINAKYATSLTVSCVNGSCYNTFFECPLAAGSSCSLHCGSSELVGVDGWNDATGCYSAHVRGNGATEIDIQCERNCGKMRISVTSNDSTTNLNCTTSNQFDLCADVYFHNYGINTISNIYCHGAASCTSIDISIDANCIDNTCRSTDNAYAAKSVMLSCTGGGACRQSGLITTAQSVTIDCNSEDSCYSPGWIFRSANANSRVTINANADYSFSNNWNGYIDPDVQSPNSTVINCGTHQECYGLVMSSSRELADFVDISCDDSVDGCASVYMQCLFGVKTTTTLLSPFGEYYCDPQSIYCCPFGATFGPTASPTTSGPTTAPTTAQPTASPTTANPTIAPVTAQPTATPSTASPTTPNPTATPSTGEPTASPTTGDPTASPITAYPTALPTSEDPTATPQIKTTDIVDQTTQFVTRTSVPRSKASHLFSSSLLLVSCFLIFFCNRFELISFLFFVYYIGIYFYFI